MPTQERALKKRQALIDAACLAFAEAGFEDTTAKTIAAKAGVATGTFYQYFDNKNELLRLIAKERFANLQDTLRGFELHDAKTNYAEGDAIESLFLNSLQFVHRFHQDAPQLHQVLEQRRLVDCQLQAIMTQGEAVLRERIEKFAKAMQLPSADLVAQNLFCMAEGLVHGLMQQPSDKHAQSSLELGAQMLAAWFRQQLEAKASRC